MRALIGNCAAAVRSLARDRVYTAAVIMTFSLGLAATSAVFSIIDALYLTPLPFRDPNRLVMLWESEPAGDPHWTVAPENYLEWRRETRSMTDLAAFNVWLPTMRGAGDAEPVLGSIVTPNFFGLLGVQPALGRLFVDRDAQSGATPVTVISYGLWQRRFAGDPAVIGRPLRLGDTQYTIVGVLPAGYEHPERQYNAVQVWAPLVITPSNREGRWMRVIGRMRDGYGVGDVRREFETIAARLERSYPERNRGWRVNPVPIADELFSGAKPAVLLLIAGAVFVFLVVAVNIANLTLARGLRRMKQYAIRGALGATRGSLLAQAMTESLVMAVAGAVLGVWMLGLGGDGLRAMQQQFLSGVVQLRMDGRVVAFVLTLAAVTALAVGIIPALRASRVDLRAVLGESSRMASSRTSRRVARLLIAGELMLTTVLLVGTALLTRSLLRLTSVPTGISAEKVLTLETRLPRSRYPDSARVTSAYRELVQRIANLGGVSAVAVASDIPFSDENRFLRVSVPGASDPSRLPLIEYRAVTLDYFRVLGLAVETGEVPRAPTSGDRLAAIVNRRMADQLWPRQNALGQGFIIGEGNDAVGAVVAAVVSNELDDGYDAPPDARLYLPFESNPGSSTIMVRAVKDPAALAPVVRRTIAEFDREIALGTVAPLQSLIDGTVAGRRAAVILIVAFSTFALALAGVGIYGVIAYSVDDRAREIALRVALGALPGDIRRLIYSDVFGMALAGLAAGLSVAYGITRLLRGFLFGISEHDALSFALVGIVVVGVAGAAAAAPMRRALRLDPAGALKE